MQGSRQAVDSGPMSEITIVDVTDASGFGLVPPCADPGFDHRTCDYWEDADHGSKASRLSWLKASSGAAAGGTGSSAAAKPRPANPVLADLEAKEPIANPFATERPANPFLTPGEDDAGPVDNPFAPRPVAKPTVASDAPRKLQLLGRGLAVFGSYAKVLEVDGEALAYCQFGPLSAYPRAQRVRDLYPKLPSAPLPAVITCIATTPAGRGRGLARDLVVAVVEDLASRGFSAVEAYPEPESKPDATSAAKPAFWLGCGFDLAIDDPRFPVVRREL